MGLHLEMQYALSQVHPFRVRRCTQRCRVVQVAGSWSARAAAGL